MKSTPSETKRLANAVTGIAATIAEIIDAAVGGLGADWVQPSLKPAPADPSP